MAGGGYHITQRKYNGQYLKVESLFQVPVVCVSEPDSSQSIHDGVLPEFVHGFHTQDGGNNFDAGLVFSRYKNEGFTWRLFHSSQNAFSNTTWTQSSSTFSLSPGSQVYLTSVVSISEKNLITELRTSRASSPFQTLRTPLNSTFYDKAVKSGCYVYREILMASNRTGTSYYNTNARFEFAKFTYGKLTNINGAEINMLDTGKQAPSADNGVKILSSRYRQKTGGEMYDGVAFGYELGSCDMTSAPHFDHSDWAN